jgi:hypothetical protein
LLHGKVNVLHEPTLTGRRQLATEVAAFQYVLSCIHGAWSRIVARRSSLHA